MTDTELELQIVVSARGGVQTLEVYYIDTSTSPLAQCTKVLQSPDDQTAEFLRQSPAGVEFRLENLGLDVDEPAAETATVKGVRQFHSWVMDHLTSQADQIQGPFPPDVTARQLAHSLSESLVSRRLITPSMVGGYL